MALRLSPRTGLIACASVTAALLVVPAVLRAQAGAQAGAHTATAQVWPYKDLCPFPDPPNFPAGLWRPASGQFAISFRRDGECKNLIQYQLKPLKLERPPAVRVGIRNDGAAELRVPIKSLASITITGKSGQPLPAILWRTRIDRENPQSGGQEARAFVWEVSYDGVFAMVPAGKTVDFMFFFRTAAVGDVVRIENVTSATVE